MFKRYISRALSLVLTLAVMLSVIGVAPLTAQAATTPSGWAVESVEEAKASGLTTDDLLNDFTATTTRIEFCRAAVNMLRQYGYNVDAVTPKMFSDTNDVNIGIAAALGITNGTDAARNLFTPNGELTREQAATMLDNFLNVLGKQVRSSFVAWIDSAQISSWASQSASDMYNAGVIGGTSTTQLVFSPKTAYTHEQSLATLVRLWKLILNSDARTVHSEDVSGLSFSQAYGINNVAGVSSVQQFPYKNEGLAFGYVNDNTLVIKTPNGVFNLEMKYPSLGDIISDDAGNFYVVWGRSNETDNSTVETVFISKYSPTGTHIKTTGFVGESRMGDSGNTKFPFRSGNCTSAIGNGRLIVNYARSMYNGHQSNSVIGVTLSDMTPVNWDSVWNIPYTSHSFNQSVIYSALVDKFVYADHGDAYDRGFTITVGDNELLPFHFYLEANANYNMSVVNKTFAQLGGLAETSKGVFLVGASAKSISESAKSESQNLFVQIFNPAAQEVAPSMFIGGEPRNGATSFDINDNNNSPLTSVTDYGVHWLTNYTEKNVIAPQVVEAGDRVVILWSTDDESFYVVLSADGSELIPVTSLGKTTLNSYERPIYHDGKVIWASVNAGKLMVMNINME